MCGANISHTNEGNFLTTQKNSCFLPIQILVSPERVYRITKGTWKNWILTANYEGTVSAGSVKTRSLKIVLVVNRTVERNR